MKKLLCLCGLLMGMAAYTQTSVSVDLKPKSIEQVKYASMNSCTKFSDSLLMKNDILIQQKKKRVKWNRPTFIVSKSGTVTVSYPQKRDL